MTWLSMMRSWPISSSGAAELRLGQYGPLRPASPASVAERLVVHPRLGRRVALPDHGAEDLRELVVGPLVVRYIVERERVVILRV